MEKQRDSFFDNAKFLLIVMVVLAHLVEPMIDKSHFADVVFKTIYLFHMPCFLMIGGYFAKSFVAQKEIKMQKLFSLMVYYTVFQLLYCAIQYFCFHQNFKFSFFYAAFGLWYLQVTILYFITLPFLQKLRKMPVLIAAFAFGILISFDLYAGHFLSIMRLFTFAPFFYFGYYWDKSFVDRLKKYRWTRPAAIGFFVLFAAAVYLFPQYVRKGVLTGKHSYKALGLLDIGWVHKAVWYVLAFIAIYAFFVLVPRRKFFFTAWGGRTLQVFLLHIILILFYNEYRIADRLLEYIPWQYLAIPAGILLAIVLSWKGFSLPFTALGKLNLKRFWKEEEKRS